MLPEVFTPLPGGQDMRIGWRQLIRGGKHVGELVEDIGVISDEIIRPEPKDFLIGRTRFSQLEYIAQSLKERGRRDGTGFRTCKINYSPK